MENENMATREEQIKEANRRKEVLMKMYRVSKSKLNIINRYRKDEFYGKLIKDLEEKTGGYAYHCLMFYNILNVLYVSPNKDDWDYEGPEDNGYNEVYAFTYNESLDLKECGYIMLGEREGNIVRIG